MQIVQRGGNRLGIGARLRQFFWQYKWSWLSAIILMLLLLAGLAIFARSSDPPAVIPPQLSQ
jgi:hypothetical protein